MTKAKRSPTLNYLFFDIETVRTKVTNPRIVSFGYVLTDDNFNEIEKANILINPKEKMEITDTAQRSQWKTEGTKDKDGFKTHYHKIAGLLEDKNTIVVGHGTRHDVRYLLDECYRCHFNKINFNFLDTQIIAQSLLSDDVSKKLKDLHRRLCPKKKYKAHNSLNDARMTKEVFEVLFGMARKKEIDVLNNEKYRFDSLKCVYKENADVAKKKDGYFNCNFDIPIITIGGYYNYENGSEQIREEFKLYYDYAIDVFYHSRHPKQGNTRNNSTLPKNAYITAKKKAVYRINTMWESAKKAKNYKGFFYKEGYRLADLEIKYFTHNLASCDITATFKKDFLEFDCEIALGPHDLNNAIDCEENMVVDLKRVIKKVHNAKSANKSMLLMAKMKFGDKNKQFRKIQTEEVQYAENVEYLLAREYANIEKQPDTQKGINDRLINGDATYIPTTHAFDNNLFPEKLKLPVLAKITRQ